MRASRGRKHKRLKQNPLLIVGVIAVISIALIFIKSTTKTSNVSANQYSDLQAQLFPASGFDTKIVLGNVVPQLVQSGVVDLDKLKQIYGNNLTPDQLPFLTQPSNQPLVVTPTNTNFLLNILWPLGIANKNPVLDNFGNYQGVANLASTGGWTLSKENSMVYFDKLRLVNLTAEEQAVLEEVVNNTYRPCCDNPTVFPDCNHGAALLALLELGASQGMSKDQLYSLSLHANTLWFPQQYLSTAVLYKSQGKNYWNSAQDIMGYNYSSYSGWIKNVYTPLQQQNLLPSVGGGGSCGV